MMPGLIKTSIRIGLITAALIVLYELTNLLLIYHYFKYECYIAGAIIIALVTDVILTKKYDHQQTIESVNDNPLESLTAKELLVLELTNAAKNNKESASLNYTEMSTVKPI